MVRPLLCCSLLLCAGCTSFSFGNRSVGDGCPGSGTCQVEQSVEGVNAQAPCGNRAPECKPVEEVHVQVPKQKVIVKRPKPPPPEAPATAAVPSQEILLVPRTVYLPYAPQIPTAPARMVPLQTLPAQTTTTVPVFQAPGTCATNASSAANLAETQKQMDELAQRLQALEGTLQRLNQTVMQVGASVSKPSAPAAATTPKPELDISCPNR
jgi:hypothetical protein